MAWITLLLHISMFILTVKGQSNCVRTPLKIEIKADGSSHKHCEYVDSEGARPLHLIPGSEFTTKTCQTCKCSASGLQCCEKPSVPPAVPASCKVILDGCKYLTVSAYDYNKDCFTGQPHSKPVQKIASPGQSSTKNTEMRDMTKMLRKAIEVMTASRPPVAQTKRPAVPTPEDVLRVMNGENPRSRGLGSSLSGSRGLGSSLSGSRGLGSSLSGASFMGSGSLNSGINPLSLSGISGGFPGVGLPGTDVPRLLLGLNNGENAGFSMFTGGVGPVERMIMRDVMALNRG